MWIVTDYIYSLVFTYFLIELLKVVFLIRFMNKKCSNKKKKFNAAFTLNAIHAAGVSVNVQTRSVA